MQHARRLLERGWSTRATAPRVGYRNPSGLRQAFVRYYGCNPSEFQPPPRRYLGTLVEPEDEPLFDY